MKQIDPKKRTLVMLVGIVVLMGALSYASVPFYSWFCAVTGFGGATVNATRPSDEVLDKMITIRFDSNVDPGMPWDFKPVVKEMDLKIGETGLAFYEATNTSDRVVAGTASFNVTPYEAGGFFVKIDCFCFTQQILQPHETVQMPVTFYVDPEMTRDNDAKFVNTITLSYTFYETDLPEDYAKLADAPAKSN